jgi:signal peptidase
MVLLQVLKRVGGALALLFVISMLAGALLGQPVGPAYVETGSMAPTISAGDGFIAIPTALAGPIEEGDIVTFDAVNLNGGGLVTHRVVGTTSDGYITRGDANVVTDQDGSEPPVSESQVVAKALAIGDFVVVIPNLGTAVTTMGSLTTTAQEELAVLLGTRAILGGQGLSYILIGFGGIAYALSAYAENTRSTRRRDTSRSAGKINPTLIITILILLLTATLTMSMILPGGVHQFQYVSSESDSAGISVIGQGSNETVSYQVPSNGWIPVIVMIEPASDNVAVSDTELVVPAQTTAETNVTISAPPSTGVYVDAIVEHRYLAFLPREMISGLYRIHPWAPLIAINTVVGAASFIVSTTLVGLDPIRIGRRQRDVPLLVKIRQWLE